MQHVIKKKKKRGLWPKLAIRHGHAKSSYPSSMAPIDQYLMERNAEIALARSAAPESISRDAEVMVLGRKGYETAVQGRNGFVCMVQRSRTDKPDDPEFWNPKRRGPICFNAAAAKSYLPITIMRTNLVLAGKSKAQMFEAITAAFEKKFDSRGRRFTSPLHPSGRLIFCSTKRTRNKMKTSIGTITGTSGKRDCVVGARAVSILLPH